MEKEEMKIVAFHLPQYHSFPENDEWWGKGFTEWVNVKKAQPLFCGHNQPRVPMNSNYYNMLSKDTLIWQSELSSRYGISGFCYYHYWFSGKKLMEKPVELLHDNPDIHQKYCLCWANEPWTRSWDGQNGTVLISQEYGLEREWEEHFQYLLPFFQDSRYICIDEKPIFVIYRANSISNFDNMVNYMKQRAMDEGLKGLYVIEEKNYYQGEKYSRFTDNIIEFEPMYTLNHGRSLVEKVLQRIESDFHNILNKHSVRIYDYSKIWKKLLENYLKTEEKVIPCAFVDWDNTSRRGSKGMVIKNGGPEFFDEYIGKLIEISRRKNNSLIFINAWNEWAEGCYLEPDEKNGLKYLEVIRKRVKDGLER